MPNSFLPLLEKIKRKRSNTLTKEESLITEGNLGYSFEDPHKPFIIYYQKIILSILGIFVALLFINVLMDNHLDNLKDHQQLLIFDLDSLQFEEARIKKVDAKISYYKMSLKERVSLGGLTEFVFSSFPSNVELVSFTIDAETFRVMLKGNSPVQIASIIQSLVSESRIKSIAIESAHFDSANSIYTVQLKGYFAHE